LGKISTSVVKTSFSKNNIASYKLSILCGVDSLYYCVSNNTDEVLILKQYDHYTAISLDNEAIFANDYQEIWDSDSILSSAFSEIHIAFVRPHYTIIPKKLYQSANKASYLAPLKAKAAIPELYQVNDLSALDAHLIFSLPQAAIEFFESKYSKGIHYYNSFTSLINSFGREMKLLQGKHVWINVHPSILQIALFDGKELIFSNQFPFGSEKDFLYYALLVYGQFKLNPEVIPLHISGQLVKESAIYKQLYRYIRFISFAPVSNAYQLNNLSDKPKYFFFDLLNISQ